MRYEELIKEPEAASLLLFHTVHRVIDNINNILNIKLLIKYNALVNLDSIQQEDLKWLTKWYVVDNDNMILKKYCVNNVNYSRCEHNGCQILLL